MEPWKLEIEKARAIGPSFQGLTPEIHVEKCVSELCYICMCCRHDCVCKSGDCMLPGLVRYLVNSWIHSHLTCMCNHNNCAQKCVKYFVGLSFLFEKLAHSLPTHHPAISLLIPYLTVSRALSPSSNRTSATSLVGKVYP